MINKSYLLTLLFGLTNVLPATTLSASVTDQVIGDVRVQPLSSTLVRIELRGPAGFEDRPTFHITGRDMTGTNATRSVEGDTTVITTDSYVVRVPSDGTDLNDIVITDLAGQQLWTMPFSSEYTTIKCRWEGMGVKYLCDGGDMVSYGDTPADDSYFWKLENADGYVQIRNKATGDYMNIENNRDYVECNAVQSHWTSKDWSMVTMGDYNMILCRWIDHRDYMHTENSKGYLEHAPAGTTNGSGSTIDMWWSSLWQSASISSEFFNNNRYWLPHLQDETQAWAICDTPRYVPAHWGYDPAPAGSDNFDVNGWDLTNDSKDVYVFLPQGDSRRLREDYISLIGRSDLLPLYAFGGWDSRYYPYTQQEALDKIDRYRDEQIPLDVFVVDTDWRVGASHGYGVNTDLFPDMEQFLTDAHAKNVKITFNDHPEPQADMALDPVEVNYRNDGLRGLFDIGLDFWWFDRNWHTSLLPPTGINKEVFGMYIFHWITKSYYPERRPIIMANFDGIDNGAINRAPNIGAYRYSMQWTGDTSATFDQLTREISDAVYTGAYTPFAYLSTDLGGHNGEPSVEQYCRWVQYGALSPVFRLHCTAGQIRDPWAYGADALRIVRDFVQMRMRLLPVFYTAARNNYETGEPLLRRCDLDYPTYPQASDNTQYLLGKDILVAPVCQPDDTLVTADMFTGGVWAEYYDNMTLSDSPALTRSENDIAFDWGTGRPAWGLPSDAFSARFTTTLTVNTDTAIELGISSDDGSRLWINDQLVVDRWVDQAEALHWSGIACQPGESYNIIVEYFENAGDAVCKLNYRNFNASSVERALWLPPGLWLDCWTGEKLTGPADIARATTLNEIPLYVRSGSIIPLAPDMQYSSQRPWDNITLDV
ncbi:MAG: hypothetical protein JXM68_02730, partial [Sedimentisphaerales bacterium]|nr:hypothetical protein [Sedimentisphaerales bacterium]